MRLRFPNQCSFAKIPHFLPTGNNNQKPSPISFVHMVHATVSTSTTSSDGENKQLPEDKVLVIMGATGSGKSRLSVDLATRFFPAEIINSDKMQVYRGLDITTNKIPLPDRRGVPHHLLGDFDPTVHQPELSRAAFRTSASFSISESNSRGGLPIVAGGSNSFVHALLAKDFDPICDFFNGSPGPTRLRYNCCFLWVEVSFPILCDYLGKRVDEMLDSGMVEELEKFFALRVSGSGLHEPGIGLMKAIGVPEFESYFEKYPPGAGPTRKEEWDRERKDKYEEAAREIKENTCQLAMRQIGKIQRLRDVGGWDLHRIDATLAFRAKMLGKGKKEWMDVWEKEVLEPSVEIVRRFLEE